MMETFEKHSENSYKLHDFSYKVHDKPQPSMEFMSNKLSGVITYDRDNDSFIIKGKVVNVSPNTNTNVNEQVTLDYWASNPIVRNYSYSGSGLPYPNPDIAYENTPNKGQINLNSTMGGFEIVVKHPNSYYIDQGKTLIKPHIHIKLSNDQHIYTLIVSDNLPYRSLTNLPNQPRRTTGR